MEKIKLYAALVWAVAGTIAAVYVYMDSQSVISWTRARLTEAKRDIIPLEERAQEHLLWARQRREQAEKDAKKMIADAEKQTERVNNLLRMHNQEMNQVYPNLRKYKPGVNEVNMEYFKSFQIIPHGGFIKIQMVLENTTSQNVTPRLSLHLVNHYGFVTDFANVYWLMDSIGPGERKIEYVAYVPLHGDPVYYNVSFN